MAMAKGELLTVLKRLEVSAACQGPARSSLALVGAERGQGSHRAVLGPGELGRREHAAWAKLLVQRLSGSACTLAGLGWGGGLS